MHEVSTIVINSSSHYIIMTSPDNTARGESTVFTNLSIVNFITGDIGLYSFQGYYNPKKVTSSKAIVSTCIFTINKDTVCYMQEQANMVVNCFNF